MKNIRYYVFFALDKLKGSHYRKAINEIIAVNTRYSENKAIPEKALEKLLKNATENVEYYKPYKDKSFEEFPIVTKLSYKENTDKFISQKFDKKLLYKSSTSGSTGTPFVVYQNPGKRICVHSELIDKGDSISVIEFCARTGGGDKFRLIKKASGFDVIKAAVDLALGEKPHVEFNRSEKFIVDEFLYCNKGIFDKLDGFDEMLRKGNITEYYQLKQKGAEIKEIASSGDRIAYFTIEADSKEQLYEKYKAINESIKVIDDKGNDILRHDLISTFC